MTATLDWDYYPPGPRAAAFLKSNAFVRGIMGPYGSGKSVACCMEILRRAHEQKPNAAGVRRSRWAVIRNTYPELKTTTIKTWHEWVPKTVGRWVDQGPPTHFIRTDEIDLEVMFIALDSPADVKKLLSLELTGAWMNEAREIPKAVLDGLTGRVGRFPSARDGGPSWSGIIMDTNPPDTDHWWYIIAERDTSTERGRQMVESLAKTEEMLVAEGLLEEGRALFEFFRQPGGLDPNAENKKNLPPGYYHRQMAGKTEDWIKVYIDAEYGFVQDGKPIYPEFRDSIHVRDDLKATPGLALHIGIDFGLTPAAVIGQRTPMGAWNWIDELVTEDMGAKRFGELLASKLRGEYGVGQGGFTVASITGDPAGDIRAQTDEETPFRILAAAGIVAQPARTNDFLLRREAVANSLTRLIDGRPGLLISSQCRILRKGMAGAYRYRRLRVGNDDRFADKPDKNAYSHVCEAGQYMLVGGGEAQSIVRREGVIRPKFAVNNWAIYGDD